MEASEDLNQLIARLEPRLADAGPAQGDFAETITALVLRLSNVRSALLERQQAEGASPEGEEALQDLEAAGQELRRLLGHATVDQHELARRILVANRVIRRAQTLAQRSSHPSPLNRSGADLADASRELQQERHRGGEDNTPRMSVRLKDVAERAGTSIKTVSNVVNGNYREVGPATRARVLATVDELGYRPHGAAKDLRLRRTNTLGFVSDVVATTPYAGNLIKGALDFAGAEKKILMVVDTGNDLSMAEAAIEMMLERRVEAIIYAAMYHRAVQVPDNLREVPAVLLDCYCEDGSLPSVVPDEVTAGYEATESLLRKGHRRIGLINAGRVIPAAVGRLEGYRRALATYDVPFDSSLVRSGNTMADSGYRHTMDLMRLSHPPTAIFCGTDRTAMGAYQALAELGLSIPGDVAVRGFDDEAIIAPYLRPALSTTALPHYEMGQWAVKYLIKQRSGMADPQPVQHKIHCPLVEREST